MYAGGVGGGIWETTNGGDSWEPTDDLMPTLAITSIVIDPNDSNVLYCGTGEGVLTRSGFISPWQHLTGSLTETESPG